MDTEAYIVGKYPLGIGLPSFCFARQDIAYFIKIPEAGEISEAPHMIRVIRIDFVEDGVAVLESPCVYRYYQYSRSEQFGIRA